MDFEKPEGVENAVQSLDDQRINKREYLRVLMLALDALRPDLEPEVGTNTHTHTHSINQQHNKTT